MAKKLNNPVDTALFDKETLEAGLKKIELVRPDRQGLRDVEMALEQRFSKAELEKMAEVFKQAFGKCAFVCMQPNGITAICDEAMQIYNNLARKDQLATALGWLLCEPQNVKAYVDTLTQPMKNLWRHVFVNAFVTEEEAMEILGISTPMLTTQRYSYYYERPSMTRTEYDLFTTVSGRKAAMGDHYYRESCTYISVKSVIYYYFFPVFFPEAYDTGLSVAALPYESPMVLDFENESTAKYTLLNSLIKTGKLPMGAKSVSQADIKRVAKQMGLLEFFPSEQHTLYGNLRSRYYIETLALANHLADNKTKKIMKTLIPKQYGGSMLNYAQVFLSSEQKNDVEIVNELTDEATYAQLLLDTSVAISRNRFETSAQSFLAHCASRKDVEEKIGLSEQRGI